MPIAIGTRPGYVKPLLNVRYSGVLRITIRNHTDNVLNQLFLLTLMRELFSSLLKKIVLKEIMDIREFAANFIFLFILVCNQHSLGFSIPF